jgi:hypothetical protein
MSKLNYGNLPENIKSGAKVQIGKYVRELVRAGKDDFDAPLYRLRHQDNLIGNATFSIDDLNVMGATIIDGQGELKLK